ncbi:amino acid transporter [Suhomyces tanzawaensis NRRL Y-17324]|uniref:Amino acid transporter n=1 Tax=Suhomyces tanzawaensis NRRL Y-17324 TaxID=984487 RepID=A0A1E4SE37_9ASCO|nr:amino acid transporter [Suhomyces tanzawaensis NRRL Y-17324]ODV77740.1 amino acid transporter [Suhomyces tanzawaensis NRRL Y-17324]
MAPTLLPAVLNSGSTAGTHAAVPVSKKLGTLSCISLIVNKIIGTGIFLNPSPIFQYTNGNVGLFLSLFAIGGVVIFCGMLIYLEYALNLPFRNGGEKNYLLRVFNHPKGLAGCVYAFSIVILGFSSGNSYAFGKYVLFALTDHQEGDADSDISPSLVKLVGVACISFCILLHIRYPSQGTRLFNFLGIFKLLILVLIIMIGLFVYVGLVDVPPTDNFTDMWKFHNNESPNSYSIAVGLLEVIYSFKGWENVNYVLNEINDPYHVLTIAAPAAVLLTTVLYFLVLLAYLVVIPKEEILSSGVLIAGIFFNKVFGQSVTSRLLPILISLSNLGNVLVVSFAHGMVNQELALNNYIPFSAFFLDLNNSLLLHWFITVFILVAPPSAEIYEFIVNLYIYPGTWINVFLTAGLIYLKLNRKKESWAEFNPRDMDFEMEDESYKSHPSYQLIDQHENPEDPKVSTSSILNEAHSNDFEESQESPHQRHQTETDSLLNSSIESASAPPSSKKIISAPYICVVIFLLTNLFLALFPFVPPPNAALLAIPYWCFPVLGCTVLLSGAVFFYTRPFINSWLGLDPRSIKYEEEFYN